MNTLVRPFRKLTVSQVVEQLRTTLKFAEGRDIKVKVTLSRSKKEESIPVKVITKDRVTYIADCPKSCEDMMNLAPLFHSDVHEIDARELESLLAASETGELRIGWPDSKCQLAVGCVAPIIRTADDINVMLACVPPDIDEVNDRVNSLCAERGCPFAGVGAGCKDCELYLGCGINRSAMDEVSKEHAARREESTSADA
jgi:hypothetical protein